MVDEVTVSQHYFRPTPLMSSRGWDRIFTAAAIVLVALPALAQYPGQISKKSKDTPTLRAVAVLEWTGPAGKPKQCRLVPVSVYDGETLQDGGLYLAQPEPITVAGEVEYQLKENGKTIGLFDIKNAGQEQGSWVGYGDWKPLPQPKLEAAATRKIDDDADADDDKPVLHRKKSDGDSAKNGSGTTAPAAGEDPDRPKLHKKTGDDSGDSGSNSGSAPDPDRPTLHKPSSDDSSAGNSPGSAPVDPDRPVMKEPKPQPPAAATEVGHVDSLPNISDPDRPRLVRGRSTADNLKVLPSLMGLPPDMKQAVAVSDATNRPDHPWTFSWANSDDELKMKAQLEDIARNALGLTPPAPAAPPAKTANSRHSSKKATAPPPAEPAPLEDEQFRVFELAYGSGATMVLTAHTDGPLAQEKFITLIAQPDLYGNVMVLLKSVTDGAHLDETPRMRLVDAVDALADNRGELLFELRGDTSRQFALYRVLRGRADKLFVSFGGNYGSPVGN